MCSTTCYDAELRLQMKSLAADLFDSVPHDTVSDLVSMYMLTRLLLLTTYSDRDDACTELFYKLIPPYLTSSGRKLPERLQIDILRCIAYEMGNSVGGYLYDDCVRYYEEVCTDWLSHLGGECNWTGMDIGMAKERLQVLEDGIEIFGIDALRNRTARAYEYYHNQTT